MAVKDLFKILGKLKPAQRPGVFVACFEIYGPKTQVSGNSELLARPRSASSLRARLRSA